MKETPTWTGAVGEWLNRLAPLLLLLGVYLLFVFIAPDSFATSRNAETMLRQTTIIGTAALGMTLVIIAGGIDLSVGSMIALGTVAIASLLNRGAPPLLAVAGGVTVCGLCGLVNGLLITYLRVVPFIVTLGTLLVVRGAAKAWARDQKIDPNEFPDWLADLTASQAGGGWLPAPPLGVWIMLTLAALVALILRYTPFGRHVYAVGSNEQTARLCGVRVERVKVAVYMLSGVFAGLASMMQFSRLTVGDPTVAMGAELDVIAAVVIGGGSLAGGEGSVIGSLAGALTMNVIRSGCSHMGLANSVQEIVTGGIIVAAVALDRLRQRRAR